MLWTCHGPLPKLPPQFSHLADPAVLALSKPLLWADTVCFAWGANTAIPPTGISPPHWACGFWKPGGALGLGFLQDDWYLALVTNIIPELPSQPRTNIQAWSYHPTDPCLLWSLFPTPGSKSVFLSLVCRLWPTKLWLSWSWGIPRHVSTEDWKGNGGWQGHCPVHRQEQRQGAREREQRQGADI